MIQGIDRKSLIKELKKEKLQDYWGQFYAYTAEPDLFSLTETELKKEIEAIKKTAKPYIDSQIVINKLLTKFGKKHNFHRQFNEKLPNLHVEQVLGMQLYKIMVYDSDTWIYSEIQHPTHKFPHATYFIPKNSI